MKNLFDEHAGSSGRSGIIGYRLLSFPFLSFPFLSFPFLSSGTHLLSHSFHFCCFQGEAQQRSSTTEKMARPQNLFIPAPAHSHLHY
jgi:hypothetical protein